MCAPTASRNAGAQSVRKEAGQPEIKQEPESKQELDSKLEPEIKQESFTIRGYFGIGE
ncbi:hypothetical protein N9L76_07230 [bacterium]|nr:hypothetical protein [bacterium]